MRKTPLFFGVDTASRISSVWLGYPDRLILQIGFPQRSAMECLPGSTKTLWQKSGISPAEIGAFVVNRGPGSLTGIKIGIAFQSVLGKIFRKPVLGISGLDALAFSLMKFAQTKDTLIIPVISAVRNEVYFAFYGKASPVPKRLSEYQRMVSANCRLPQKYSRIVIGGDGAENLSPFILPEIRVEKILSLQIPTALSFLVWARKMWKKGNFEETVEPLYIYPPPIHLKPRQ